MATAQERRAPEAREAGRATGMKGKQLRRRYQHYVPRHYLRQFSRDKRKINLYNISRDLYTPAPIKSQCKEKYFYGVNERWEEWLGKIESECATALRILAVTDTVPPRSSYDCTRAIMWAAVQKVRTAAHAARTREMLHTADRLIYQTEADRTWADTEGLRLETTKREEMRRISSTSRSSSRLFSIKSRVRLR